MDLFSGKQSTPGFHAIVPIPTTMESDTEPMSTINTRKAPLIVVMALTLAITACQRSETNMTTTPVAPVFNFPLSHFATKTSFSGEQDLALNQDEKKSLRGALSLLEQILPKGDPRRPILRTTPIRFVESHGRRDVAARWDSEHAYIEVGRLGFNDHLRLVIVLAHELTHALHEKEIQSDILALLRSEERAYGSELSIVRPMKSIIANMDGINPRERKFFQLALARHKRSGSLLLKMTRFRITLIALAFNMSQLRAQGQAAGISPEHIQFIESCESQLQQVCLADRPITAQDGQSLDSVLVRFQTYLTTNSSFRGAGVSALLSSIEKTQMDLIEIGEASRALAAIETRLKSLQGRTEP